MPLNRDLAAFAARASTYEAGWLGRLHHEIANRAADLALAEVPTPKSILDVGCGTGYLLRSLGRRCPDAIELSGVDPAPAMIAIAAAAASDERLQFIAGIAAEHLPYPDDTFDLVVSTTSFDHWSDQRAGLAECARVMKPGGRLVLVDQFSTWLLPTLLVGRRGKARTKRRAARLLTATGLRSAEWHNLYAVLIKAVSATK